MRRPNVLIRKIWVHVHISTMMERERLAPLAHAEETCAFVLLCSPLGSTHRCEMHAPIYSIEQRVWSVVRRGLALSAFCVPVAPRDGPFLKKSRDTSCPRRKKTRCRTSRRAIDGGPQLLAKICVFILSSMDVGLARLSRAPGFRPNTNESSLECETNERERERERAGVLSVWGLSLAMLRSSRDVAYDREWFLLQRHLGTALGARVRERLRRSKVEPTVLQNRIDRTSSRTTTR